MKILLSMGLNQYKYTFNENEAPPAGHLFATHYLYEAETLEKYLNEAQKSFALYQKLTSQIGFDPVKNVYTKLNNATGLEVSVAEENNSRYFHCIARELNHSVLLHPDFAPFHAKNRTVGKISSQFAWNIYLTDPIEGGATTIYNRPWNGSSGDKLYATSTYGYANEVVKNHQKATFKINPGSLVFFNYRNFHEVQGAKQPRISIGGHFGLTTDNRIIGWS